MKSYQRLKIVGGRQEKDIIPWIASLQLDDFHFCGASVISDKWLISAKHCFNNSSSYIDVKTGSLEVNDIRMKVSNIDMVYSHPTADVSLIKLIEPIDGIRESINILDGEIPTDSKLKVLGWGLTQENGLASNTLKSVEVTLKSDEICGNSDNYFDKKVEICAGGVKGEDSCQGDSGGPLVYVVDGVSYLVGVVSRGDGCAREGNYGVYISILKIRTWIESVMKDDFDKLSFIDYKNIISGGGEVDGGGKNSAGGEVDGGGKKSAGYIFIIILYYILISIFIVIIVYLLVFIFKKLFISNVG